MVRWRLRYLISSKANFASVPASCAAIVLIYGPYFPGSKARRIVTLFALIRRSRFTPRKWGHDPATTLRHQPNFNLSCLRARDSNSISVPFVCLINRLAATSQNSANEDRLLRREIMSETPIPFDCRNIAHRKLMRPQLL